MVAWIIQLTFASSELHPTALHNFSRLLFSFSSFSFTYCMPRIQSLLDLYAAMYHFHSYILVVIPQVFLIFHLNTVSHIQWKSSPCKRFILPLWSLTNSTSIFGVYSHRHCLCTLWKLQDSFSQHIYVVCSWSLFRRGKGTLLVLYSLDCQSPALIHRLFVGILYFAFHCNPMFDLQIGLTSSFILSRSINPFWFLKH
jgi:hypothetical protein